MKIRLIQVPYDSGHRDYRAGLGPGYLVEGGAERLLADGYRVVINGLRNRDAVSETLGKLSLLGDITYVAADIGTAGGRSHLAAETLTAVGRLDVLVNNAGITSPGRKDILEATEEDLDTVLAVNLKGPLLLTQIVARHMIEERASDPEFRGRIVNITSISAAVATPNRSEYCISKAGLSMTTKLWATRLAEHGIEVFEVQPGVIRTDMTAPAAEKYTLVPSAVIEPGPSGGSTSCTALCLIDLYRVGEQKHEGDVRHQQGQDQVERLADDIQGHRLAAFHLLRELGEVGLEADGNEGQAEEPTAQRVGYGPEHG